MMTGEEESRVKTVDGENSIRNMGNNSQKSRINRKNLLEIVNC